MAVRNIGRTCVDILAIHFVREEIQVVLLHQIAYLVHLPASIKITCRVVGVTDHNSSCALVDQFLKLLHLWQRESLFDSGGNRTDLSTCRDGKCHIVSISRLWHDNLIAWVQTAEEGKEHRLTTTRGNDDIIGRDVDIVFRVIVHQFFAIAYITLRGRVLQNLTVYLLQGVKAYLWCGQIRLSNVQVIHLGTSLLGGCSQWCEFPDRRLGHFQATN